MSQKFERGIKEQEGAEQTQCCRTRPMFGSKTSAWSRVLESRINIMVFFSQAGLPYDTSMFDQLSLSTWIYGSAGEPHPSQRFFIVVR